MTDTDGSRRRGGSTLALKLTVAFVSVALAAVLLLGGLTAAFAARDVWALTNRHRSDLTKAIAVVAATGWDRSDSWASASLTSALDLAAQTGGDAEIRDRAGRIVASSPGFRAHSSASRYSATVIADRRPVGRVIAWFAGSGLSDADHALLIALLRAITGAGAIAALVALLTGLVAARRVSRPVKRIIAVTRARGRGERSARVGEIAAPSELGELARAFDEMSAAVDHHDQMRRDMVADVAHELRTPVAVLQAGHEALLDQVAEPTPDQLSSLRDEVLRMSRMINDLQTLAAADAAVLQLSRRRCDLAEIAAKAADSLAAHFEMAGLTLERHLTPAAIYGDPRWLLQVVTNLLTNALKYTPPGGQVSIQVARDRSAAVLAVTDTGVGIPHDELPYIFDRFWRGTQATQTSGSGVGLTVAAELSRAHGGRLTASSSPGCGTTMTLTLPGA